ncbi:group II intron maturase-specific domain-containing protein [Undibacterium sp. JH2W]|uniref:group II intron maturase-specific domain-containing protein n=1 Tax=Undibacterium sp. JH2W TaxID=3413037 RepID=UPI003BF3D9CE
MDGAANTRLLEPALRGWIEYYGAIRRSCASSVLRHFDLRLAKWFATKHKRGQSGTLRRGWLRLTAFRQRCPHFFAHWAWAARCAGQTNDHVSGRAG